MKKKLFVTVLTTLFLGIILITNLSVAKLNVVKAEGICCDEKGSICIKGTTSYTDKYYKSSSPCKDLEFE